MSQQVGNRAVETTQKSGALAAHALDGPATGYQSAADAGMSGNGWMVSTDDVKWEVMWGANSASLFTRTTTLESSEALDAAVDWADTTAKTIFATIPIDVVRGSMQLNHGATEPYWKEAGDPWLDTTPGGGIEELKLYDSAAWVPYMRFNTTDHELGAVIMSDTHAAWDLGAQNVVEIGGQGAVYGAKGASQCGIGSNFYLAAAAAPKYKAAGFASRIRFNSGDIIFEAAASGAADGAITWVSPLVWDYAGDVVAFRDVTNAEMIRFQYDGTQIQVRPIISTSSSVPTYSWQGDTDTGFHRGGSNKIQVICGGVVAANFVAEGVAFGPSWVGSAQPISNATWGAVSDESRVVGTFEAKHASQASSIVQMRADRASSTAYNFLQCLSNDAVSDDNEFVLKGDGNGTCDGGWTGGGADYAELFEWADGNPTGEDRVGYSVALVGDKIKIAEPADEVVGAISGAYTALGDAAGLKWTGRYEKDDFGRYVMEDYEVVEWVESIPAVMSERREVPTDVMDEEGNPIMRVFPAEETVGEQKKTHSYDADSIPADVKMPPSVQPTRQQRRKHSAGFDPAIEYTPRVDRDEWSAVGLMGKVRIRKGQQTAPGWRKLKDVSATVELWLVK